MIQPVTMQEIDTWTDAFLSWMFLYLPQVLGATFVLVVGFLMVHFVTRGFETVLGRSHHVDISVRQILTTALRYVMIIFVVIIALSQLGVQTTSLFAILGAAGLAIGLALQGTLTNIAAGVMLLWLRPFRLGDYIEVSNQGIAGTVREMGLFACRLETVEGVSLFAPNAQIWNFSIANHKATQSRLVAVQVTIPQDAPADDAVTAIVQALRGASFVDRSHAPSVFVESVGADGYVLAVRFRTPRTRLAAALQGLHDVLRQGFAAKGIEFSAPFRLVRQYPVPSGATSFYDEVVLPPAEPQPRKAGT